MKNAAKCDTSCELQIFVSHQNFERNLHFRQGVCLLECLFIPTLAPLPRHTGWVLREKCRPLVARCSKPTDKRAQMTTPINELRPRSCSRARSMRRDHPSSGTNPLSARLSVSWVHQREPRQPMKFSDRTSNQARDRKSVV